MTPTYRVITYNVSPPIKIYISSTRRVTPLLPTRHWKPLETQLTHQLIHTRPKERRRKKYRKFVCPQFNLRSISFHITHWKESTHWAVDSWGGGPLVFQSMHKHLLVTTILLWHDLKVYQKSIKYHSLKKNIDTILIYLCQLVNFRFCVKVLTFWNVSKCATIFSFWIRFSVLWH